MFEADEREKQRICHLEKLKIEGWSKRLWARKRPWKRRNKNWSQNERRTILHEIEKLKAKNEIVDNQLSISKRTTIKLPNIKMQKFGGKIIRCKSSTMKLLFITAPPYSQLKNSITWEQNWKKKLCYQLRIGTDRYQLRSRHLYSQGTISFKHPLHSADWHATRDEQNCFTKCNVWWYWTLFETISRRH